MSIKFTKEWTALELRIIEGLKEAALVREIIEEVYGMKDKSVPTIIDNKGQPSQPNSFYNCHW